ncbi:hypothetical protein H2204_011742 [Knufia peltigerae]|uniref:SnoaL-like domain-containing protein n=1 Tax=Knufia peltigerae TaxID=1002370 RepID=A0AA38XTQ3_9EURO|nr:hypothetical protein H2204_011742 [Knufia peltigerae]
MSKYQDEVDKAYAELSNEPPHTEAQAQIIRNLLELYIGAFCHGDLDVAHKFLSPSYKQHNPDVGDGKEGLIDFLKHVASASAQANGGKPVPPKFHFKRALVDGQFVSTHFHMTRWPGDRGMSIMDIFKHEGGQFVEHWECITEIPENSKNSNGMF